MADTIMKYDLNAFYVVCPQAYDENYKEYKKFRIRYPNRAFPTSHPSYHDDFIRDYPSGEVMFFTSWNSVPYSSPGTSRARLRVTLVHRGGITDISQYKSQRPDLDRETMHIYLGQHCILKPQKFEVSDGPALSPGSNIVRLLKNPYDVACTSTTPLVLIQTREEVETLVDTILSQAHDAEDAPLKKKKSKQDKLVEEHLKTERQKIRDYADKLPALLIEVLPDGRLLSRQANAARLRLYNLIPPKDAADKAAKGVVDDDFAQEIELWKKFAVIQRRPKMRVAEGVNRELFKRFDSDVAEGQYDDPEFYVKKLEDHALEGREYEYKVKWL
ncbi:hypothetical protein HDU67_009852, partial [Dinochytrium kinnereticum]